MTKVNKNGSLHDSQKSKVYGSENAAFKMFPEDGVSLKFLQEFKTVEDCMNWVVPVVERKTFQRWYPRSGPYLLANLERQDRMQEVGCLW